MNYAANTGKESMFLERCVSNGYKMFYYFVFSHCIHTCFQNDCSSLYIMLIHIETSITYVSTSLCVNLCYLAIPCDSFKWLGQVAVNYSNNLLLLIFSRKYCSLLLLSNFMEGPGKVLLLYSFCLSMKLAWVWNPFWFSYFPPTSQTWAKSYMYEQAFAR